MPFYYDVTRSATTNGTGNTCSTHLRLLTVANQMLATIVQIMAAFRNSTTAGSGFLSIARLAAAGAGGTSLTPAPANPLSRAADTTAFTDATAITSGAATTRRFGIGLAQTGGQGGWVALERDNGEALAPNGGANGNLQLDSFTATASQLLEVSGQFIEG